MNLVSKKGFASAKILVCGKIKEKNRGRILP